MTAPLRFETDDPDLVVGLVEADGVVWAPSPPALAAEIDAVVAARSAGGTPEAPAWPPAEVRSAIRDLLRRGGYKPTGRGKPASEFLAQAAARGEFPRIANAVDALNLVSFDSGLPISLLDVDRATAGGASLVLRHGRAGESFVFNASGQSIDVAGLVGVARDGGAPVANPVKDSMETKLRPESVRLLAVIYGSRKVAPPARMREVADRLAALFAAHCGGAAPATVRVRVVPADAPDVTPRRA